MNYLFRNIILTTMLGALALAPAFASADSNSKDKAEKRQEKIEKRIEKEIKKQEKREDRLEKKISRKNTQCWNRFFHRMLPFSWVRANLDSINLDSECQTRIPRATSTPDTVAPIISNIATRTGSTRALVIWNTNEKATGKIYYSTSSPVNLDTASTLVFSKKVLGGKEHYAVISGLASSTTYYFVIEAKDKAGNTTRSNQSSFTTKGVVSPIPADTTPPILSSIGTTVSTSTINVSWNTNESATSKVYYSTSTPINTSLSNFLQSGSLVTSHNLKIENLATSTLYYLLVESVDSSANTGTSSIFSTTTTAP